MTTRVLMHETTTCTEETLLCFIFSLHLLHTYMHLHLRHSLTAGIFVMGSLPGQSENHECSRHASVMK